MERKPLEDSPQKLKTSNYFTHVTELSILKFQKETDEKEKAKIFLEEIRPAFLKLVENVIFVYKFNALGNIDVLKYDCVSFLFESLYKFDGSKGHKAFSYFNVICKHWFIQRIKTAKKSTWHDVQLDSSVLTELEKTQSQAVIYFFEDEVLKREFFELLRDEVKNWRNKLEKPQEQKVLEAIVVLLENPDIISLYNKKSVYMYLRDICGGLNTKQIVTNLSKLKKKYFLFKKRYEAGEV